MVGEKHSFRQQRPTICLPQDGCIKIAEKLPNNQLLKICLTSVNENSMRIITLEPFYVVCNLSKHQLKFHAFCIHRNESVKYDDIVQLINKQSTSKSIPDNSQIADNM